MKITLSLAVLGLASLALCNCQKRSSASIPSVATASAPRAEVLDKSYAPTNIKGKTIVLSMDGSTVKFPFPNGNTNGKAPNGSRVQHADGMGWDDVPYTIYTKTSSTTARLYVNSMESEATYDLKFTSHTSGTAKGKGSFEDDNWINNNITFIIK